MDGIINVDKPPGITSAGAVGRVKRLLPKGTKIGHAGTLDPFATGVLLLLVGKATKLCESLMDQPKQYVTTVMLGSTTPTDDPESSQIVWPALTTVDPPSISKIDHTLQKFVGQIIQQPPIYSALRVNGKRAYALARAGKVPVLAPRQVNIYSIENVGYEWPLLRLKVDCGRGTYIRSLARDIGAALDVGGHLTQLRRTRVGDFWIDSAMPLADLSATSVVNHLRLIDGSR